MRKLETDEQLLVLASHFSGVSPGEIPEDFKCFLDWSRENSLDRRLRQIWKSMDALPAERQAKQYYSRTVRNNDPAQLPSLTLDETGGVYFGDRKIGTISSYCRTVLPQETQIKIAYDSLVDRFFSFLAKTQYTIVLNQNAYAVNIFTPRLDFELNLSWSKFVDFAYSEAEIRNNFVMLVNGSKLTNRGFGYVRFPPATKAMAHWLAAFYIATLRYRLINHHDDYRATQKEVRKEAERIRKAKDDLSKSDITERRRVSNQERLEQATTAGRAASDQLREISHRQKMVFAEALDSLRSEVNRPDDFDCAKTLAKEFNRLAQLQFSFGTVKPRLQKGKIEDQIVEILNEPLWPLSCPLSSIEQPMQTTVRRAGDDNTKSCYSCGRALTKEDKQTANRFVFQDPSQRLQSGGTQTQPKICNDCFTVAFACPVKLMDGSIVLQISPKDSPTAETTVADYLRMWVMGEQNMMAGRYVLLQCLDFVGADRTPVSDKIGSVQYALWKIARSMPSEAVSLMSFRLTDSGSEIDLPTRHLVWLSLIGEIFKPQIVVNQRDNISLGQAIRLIQKDDVIPGIYSMVSANFSDGRPNDAVAIRPYSFAEQRKLEELREKHHQLLQGDSLMNKAQLARDTAALTGMTYAYCSYVQGELRKTVDTATVKREVQKLIEKVVDPSFFIYDAAQPLSGTYATMYRSDDNYFCYDQAKALLVDCLGLELEKREKAVEDQQRQFAIYFDDLINAYSTIFKKYPKSSEQRKLLYRVKLNLYAKFSSLFSDRKGE